MEKEVMREREKLVVRDLPFSLEHSKWWILKRNKNAPPSVYDLTATGLPASASKRRAMYHLKWCKEKYQYKDAILINMQAVMNRLFQQVKNG